jgi:hypothetical protein
MLSTSENKEIDSMTIRITTLAEAFLKSIEPIGTPAQAIWEFAALTNTILGAESVPFPIKEAHRLDGIAPQGVHALQEIVKLGIQTYHTGYGLVAHHLLLAIVHVPFSKLDPLFIREVLAFVGDDSSNSVRWFDAWRLSAKLYLEVFDRYAEAIIAERKAEVDEANAALLDSIDPENLPDWYDEYNPEPSDEDWYQELSSGYYHDLGLSSRYE